MPKIRAEYRLPEPASSPRGAGQGSTFTSGMSLSHCKAHLISDFRVSSRGDLTILWATARKRLRSSGVEGLRFSFSWGCVCAPARKQRKTVLTSRQNIFRMVSGFSETIVIPNQKQRLLAANQRE